MGRSGTASIQSVSALYLNPAGLTGLVGSGMEAAGEFGFKRGASQVVFRNTGTVEITAVTTLITGDLHVTGQVIQGYGGSDQVGLGTHNHADPQGGNTGAPNPGT